MKTNPNKEYHLRNMNETYGTVDGWVGRRMNGSLYLKRFPKNASIFRGGPKLDEALKKNPEFKAIEITFKT